MESWNFKEQRQSARYEVTLSALANHGLVGDPLTVTSRDIGGRGAGLIVDRLLSPGETIDITLIMPDNGEKIRSKGTVAWAAATGPNRYRAGVALDCSDLRPISIVMRSIRARTSRYNG
ncbi:MAG: PilZ domain-containing protein [Candidatus Omnitrophota bacterium]